MLIENEAFWLGALIVLALGLLVIVTSFRARSAKQSTRKMPVKVVTYHNGKCYKFGFSTIGDAAAYALGRLSTGEGVAYIEENGKVIWNSLKGKRSLAELVK